MPRGRPATASAAILQAKASNSTTKLNNIRSSVKDNQTTKAMKIPKEHQISTTLVKEACVSNFEQQQRDAQFEKTQTEPINAIDKVDMMSTPQPNYPPRMNNAILERLNLEKQFIQQSLNAIHIQQIQQAQQQHQKQLIVQQQQIAYPIVSDAAPQPQIVLNQHSYASVMANLIRNNTASGHQLQRFE